MSEAGDYAVLMHTLAHVDNEPPESLRDLDRKPAPWESSMQATCECLSWRGSLDNVERRHAEDELGETLYSAFPPHTRSALVVAHSLMDRGVISQDELQSKMQQVRARMEAR